MYIFKVVLIFKPINRIQYRKMFIHFAVIVCYAALAFLDLTICLRTIKIPN